MTRAPSPANRGCDTKAKMAPSIDVHGYKLRAAHFRGVTAGRISITGETIVVHPIHGFSAGPRQHHRAGRETVQYSPLMG
jgi:hypothetical protein